MRLLILLLLSIPIFSLGQTGNLKLKIREKYNHLNRDAWEQAWIYNADTSYKQYCSVHKQKVIFDSLPIDNYTIMILSKYGYKKYKRNIKMDSSNSLNITINPKHGPFIEYKDTIPLSSLMKENDTYSIQYTLQVCRNSYGHTYSEWADIYRKQGKVYMRYSESDSVHNVQLSSEQIQKLIEAEARLLTERVSFFNMDYEYTVRLNNIIIDDRHTCYDIIKHILKP